MKLHRDLGMTQKTAWFMLHRIRETWANTAGERFTGPVEVDETFIGGKARNMHADKRAKLTGRGGVDKTPVVGIKDRRTGKVTAQVVPNVDTASVVPFVEGHTKPTATVYSDGHRTYRKLKRLHEYVEHSVGEYVRGMAHTNGIESHWSLLKRGYVGTYHYMSRKHLHRYVNELTGRHNIREQGTVAQMEAVAVGMVGKRVRYRELVGDAEPVVLTLFDEPW